MHKRFLFVTGLVCLFVFSVLAGLYGREVWQSYRTAAAQASFRPATLPDDVVAPFSRQFAAVRIATQPQSLPDDAFLRLDGVETRLSDFKGMPLLVNFWATWCAPCVVELPALKRLQDHYEGKIRVIGIAMEAGRDEKAVAAFLNGRKLGDFAGYLDKNGDFAEKLGLKGLPTTYLIDSEGIIQYRFDGDADWASAETRAFFDVFLSQNK